MTPLGTGGLDFFKGPGVFQRPLKQFVGYLFHRLKGVQFSERGADLTPRYSV